MLNSLKYRMMYSSRLKKCEDFLKCLQLNEASTILDVGVAEREYSPHDNFLEKNYPYRSNITALSVQELREFLKRYPDIKTSVYSGGTFPFKDKEFSAVHANAIIEHVGGNDKQIEFVKELVRCGERFFLTTPAKEFPVEMHTNMILMHWLPKRFFDKIIGKTRKAWATGDYMNLLTKSALRLLMDSVKVAEYRIITYRLMGFPYQYVVYGRS